LGAVILGAAGLRMVQINKRRHMEPVPATANGPRLQPSGRGEDWSSSTRVLADLAGRVHCFSMVNAGTARIVWGAPRRAEDFSLSTGQGRPSTLDPEAYRVGCPELSPSGRALLFAGQSQAGADEVRLSPTPDGKSAKTITSGSAAAWVDEDEFVYNVDQSHAAIFSLPTMSFSLLRDAAFGAQHVILDKAVSRKSIALLIADGEPNYAVAVYHGKRFEEEKTVAAPSIHLVQFAWRDDDLLVSYQLSASVSALGLLDWQHVSLENLGRYPGFDIIRARLSSPRGRPGDVLIARHVASDLWYYDRGHRQQLTTDGENYSGDRAPSGDLLVSKWNVDGTLNVWSQNARGELKHLTFGKVDVEPRFAPDGARWAFIDY